MPTVTKTYRLFARANAQRDAVIIRVEQVPLPDTTYKFLRMWVPTASRATFEQELDSVINSFLTAMKDVV